jgi:pyruvate,water dikinase
MAERWDVLDEPIGSRRTWTRVNVGEAFPGVPTPLTWAWAGPASDAGVCRGWVKMGVFPKAEGVHHSNVEDRFVAITAGRALLNLDRLRSIGDRIPFNSGDKIEQTLFSSDKVSASSTPVRRRYPFVMAKLPVNVSRARRALLAGVPVTDAWWRQSVGRAEADADAARALLVESAARYADTAMHQAQTTVAGQGLFDALSGLCARYDLAGSTGTLATTSEHTAEIRTVEDLWLLARTRLTLPEFLDRHGYHAPIQGELAVPSWRADPSPVLSLAETYAKRGDDENPAAAQRRRLAERDAAEQALLTRVPKAAAPLVRRLLRAVQAVVPLREIARMQFLQCYDVARAAATRLGDDLAAGGAIADPADVFYLTVDELVSEVRPDPDLVARRRERRAFYETQEIPLRFTGTPVPRPIAVPEETTTLEGIAGSPGVVEGIARVIEGPDDPNALEDGEILVAETTNPSYASFFLVAGGVVVDIGGLLSHGAIVAREMGIPCVINTRNARRTIRTGDRIRIDGTRGVVEILERAVATAPGTTTPGDTP